MLGCVVIGGVFNDPGAVDSWEKKGKEKNTHKFKVTFIY